MTLTDSQQAELATGRVVVAVPCDPQPPEGLLLYAKDYVHCGEVVVAFAEGGRSEREWFMCPDERKWHFLKYPHNLDDKIPTPAGDAIVRDVDARLTNKWNWFLTLEMKDEK